MPNSQASSEAEFIEQTADGPGFRLPLGADPIWIGREQDTCPPFFADDPFLEMRHARVSREADGSWIVSAPKSVNGIWIRVDEVRLINGCWFQLGEQRFRFYMP